MKQVTKEIKKYAFTKKLWNFNTDLKKRVQLMFTKRPGLTFGKTHRHEKNLLLNLEKFRKIHLSL